MEINTVSFTLIFRASLFITLLSLIFTHTQAQTQATDSTLSVIIGDVLIEGNKKTKRTIIIRELTFKVNETYNRDDINAEIKRSKENLLKTPLFNYVYIDSVEAISGVVTINIKVEERWYIWPEVIFTYSDRNFSTWLKRRDFTRLKFGGGITKYNFRGMNEKLRFNMVLGYEQALTLSYTDIFLDKKRRNSLAFYTSAQQQEGVEYGLQSNELQSVKVEGETAVKSFKGSIRYSYRKKIYDSHNVYLEYENWQISDTVFNLNPRFLGENVNRTNFITAEYQYQINKKDSRSYPLSGYSVLLSAKQNGLGLLENDLNFFSLSGRYSKFIKISNRFYGAGSFAVTKSLGDTPPFILKNGFGYKNNLRGYEHYVINGSDFALVNSSLKFELIKPQIVTLNFIPIKKFNKIHYALYLDIFADAGYAYERDLVNSDKNDFTNTPLFSFGAGLNIVAYYDTVIRLEYSAIHTGKNGFFLSFKVPF